MNSNDVPPTPLSNRRPSILDETRRLKIIHGDEIEELCADHETAMYMAKSEAACAEVHYTGMFAITSNRAHNVRSPLRATPRARNGRAR